MIAGQLAVVLGCYAIREYLCWPANEFCSESNGRCLRLKMIPFFGIPLFLALTVLVFLLVDGWYGWAKLFTRIQEIFSGQDSVEEIIEMQQNMNAQDVNINSQTVRQAIIYQESSFLKLSKFEGSCYTPRYAVGSHLCQFDFSARHSH